MPAPSNVFRFVIGGRPFGQQRHRTRVFGNRAMMYDPAANKAFKKKALELFAVGDAIRGTRWDPSGPMSLRVEAIYPCTKAPRKREPHPRSWRTKKHDLDNILKAIMDALNGVAWEDDAQVVIVHAQKYEDAQGLPPRTVVTIERVLDNHPLPA